ncbi:MAG: M67 family metallopeptidase [Gemmatimonadota bacterium]
MLSTDAVSGPPIRMAASAFEMLARHARDAFPRECCGALLGPVPACADERRRVDVVLQAVNEANDAARYGLGAEAVRALDAEARARGLCVVGYYHSHPDGQPRPSVLDRDLAWPWLVYVIQPVDDAGAAEPAAWMLEQGRRNFVRCPLTVDDPED